MESIDPKLDLFEEIEKLKKEKNAVILAHYYQDPDIQDLADFIGDSLQLAQEAKNIDADMIVFCGVHFMAETAKMLNPTKKVIIPDMEAGCSLASSCPADKFSEFKEKHPDHLVVSYVNSTAEVKALTDICCTSSNAVKVIDSIPKDKKIIFAPDKNLGAYLMKETGREMILWQGSCEVHETFSEKKLVQLKTRYNKAKVIAHPECEDTILRHADFIGSTARLLSFVQEDENKEFIVVTEEGIIHQMELAAPNKTFIPAPPEEEGCACNQCPYMRLNTLEKLYIAMRNEINQIQIDENLRLQAVKSINRMLEIS
jgi:quinolinate synthase